MSSYLWRGDYRHEWYDWAVVWRYWNGKAEGLRTPTYPEARELLRLAEAEGIGPTLLARRTGIHEATIHRWVGRFAEGELDKQP